MAAQRRRDTAPELALRRELYRLGLRFRVDRPLDSDRRRRADIVFGPVKVAVYVDGCFWHGCPEHGNIPKSNNPWWAQKLDRNAKRDRDTDQLLMAEGWAVVRVWEHENSVVAAQRVATLVVSRRRGHGG